MNNNIKSNPIPSVNKKLINETSLNENNIFKDKSNLGNYLINTNTHKQMLEGFENNNDTNTNTINNTKTINNKNTIKIIIKITIKIIKRIKNNKYIDKLLSGDFVKLYYGIY